MKRSSRLVPKIFFLAMASLLVSGCFIFYDGSMDGFTVDGIYDGGNPTTIGLCPDATMHAALMYMYDSYDFESDPNAGSIAFNVTRTCFPDDAPTGFSRFDFVSPPLTDWNDVTGFNFIIKSFVNNIQLQPLLMIRKADGRIVSHRMSGYITVPNDWAWHPYTYVRPPIDPTDNVIEMRIRVFIPNRTIATLGLESYFIYLDDVIPQRP